MTEPESVEEYLARQNKEWTTYTAIRPIMHDGVRAAQIGDPVPVSNVELHGYLEQGLVAENTTKADAAATEADAADTQNGTS